MVESEIVRERCAQDAYLLVTTFLGATKRDAPILTFSRLIDELLLARVHVDLVLPLRFACWPKWWKYWRLTIPRIRAKVLINETREKRAVVHYAMAESLYSISDIWTHVVVELYESDGTRGYFDPYASILNVDYPEASMLDDAPSKLIDAGGAFAIARFPAKA